MSFNKIKPFQTKSLLDYKGKVPPDDFPLPNSATFVMCKPNSDSDASTSSVFLAETKWASNEDNVVLGLNERVGLETKSFANENNIELVNDTADSDIVINPKLQATVSNGQPTQSQSEQRP
ncbi:unnamed protein product [Parnassius apollo]|uniref:(apollo) hypothetical protein n=1 Tax=Parnassius apollo TaxID=110799 RepID=A0A8S3XFM5_PARAO|nr:unnamed protein product [Parnassius apollo]